MRLRERVAGVAAAALLGSAAPVSAPAPPYQPPQHVEGWPALATGADQARLLASLDLGPDLERGRSARFAVAEHRRLDTALAAVQPQRPGIVDAYVVAVALDSDPVFGREAREAGRVLARRFDAAGRTIILAGSDGRGPSALPMGSLQSLTLALGRAAELMDRDEDALVLYTTSHGASYGTAYHDGDEGYGVLSPKRLAALLEELGIRRRVLILSACYSGVFVPALRGPDTVLFTAAAADRTSFGCAADNDWTFFGDAMINHALRKPQPLLDASAEALGLISLWETARRYEPSFPQIDFGAGAAAWLKRLEARMPREPTAPVGRPAAD